MDKQNNDPIQYGLIERKARKSEVFYANGTLKYISGFRHQLICRTIRTGMPPIDEESNARAVDFIKKNERRKEVQQVVFEIFEKRPNFWLFFEAMPVFNSPRMKTRTLFCRGVSIQPRGYAHTVIAHDCCKLMSDCISDMAKNMYESPSILPQRDVMSFLLNPGFITNHFWHTLFVKTYCDRMSEM